MSTEKERYENYLSILKADLELEVNSMGADSELANDLRHLITATIQDLGWKGLKS